MNESKSELVKNYGLPGATTISVIRTIEVEKLSDIDRSTIKKLWKDTYKELSPNNKEPVLKCDFQSFKGLILNGHIKFRHDVTIKDGYTFGKNYNYVKTAINILKRDYDSKWPKTLKVPELWKQVFIQLKKREIAHNSQLHVLKALVENGMIDLVNK